MPYPYLQNTGLMGAYQSQGYAPMATGDPNLYANEANSIRNWQPTITGDALPAQSGASGLGGIMGAAAGAGSLFGIVSGIGQLLKAGRMHPQRPTYEIPDETKQMLGLRENLLNAEMPGEQQARQDIATNQANAMSDIARGTSDQGQYLGLLGALQGQANKSYNNLATEQAQNYNNNLGLLGQAQRAMAAAKDKAFELNKYDPYLMQLQHKYQLQNSGNQSISNGISGLASAAMALAM